MQFKAVFQATISLDQLVADFASAFKAVDSTQPIGRSKTRTYKPGIGPLQEREVISRALRHLKSLKPHIYSSASPKKYPGLAQQCDLVVPDEWALEFKLLRPFGDNGAEAEHWSENVLHPYKGNVSSIGDVFKLRDSAFRERKGIIIFGYEHSPPRIELSVAISAFELIAQHVVRLKLGPRCSAFFNELIHPYHQQGWIYGWELL